MEADEIDSERTKFFERIHELPQTPGEPVVTINDNAIDGPPLATRQQLIALRVQSFLGTLTRDYRKKCVLVVCHSVVVLIFRRLLERWNEDEYLKIDQEQDVLNCSMTAYRYDAKMGKLLLDYYNKVSHSDG